MEHVEYEKQRRDFKRKIVQSLIILASVLVAVTVQQTVTNDQSFAVRILSISTMVMCFLQSMLVYITVEETPVKPPPPPPETSNPQETSIRTPPCLQYCAPRPGSEQLAQRLNEAQSRQSGFFGQAMECFIKEGNRTTTGYFIPTASAPTCDEADEKDNEYSEVIERPVTTSASEPQVHVGRDEPDTPTNPEFGDESPARERSLKEN